MTHETFQHYAFMGGLLIALLLCLYFIRQELRSTRAREEDEPSKATNLVVLGLFTCLSLAGIFVGFRTVPTAAAHAAPKKDQLVVVDSTSNKKVESHH